MEDGLDPFEGQEKKLRSLQNLLYLDKIRKSKWINKLTTKSTDSRTTDRKTAKAGNEFQFDLKSTANTNRPKLLIVARQLKTRAAAPNKAVSIATFDKIDVRKSFAEIDGVQYPKDFIDIKILSR